ncbi:EamA family transporter [Tessaracoccus aquimaris]|nr:EamA family transporter [Tessaracoccus aquimaris]
MALQTWAQRHIPPTRTALLMTLEPVFASAFAVAFGGEHVTLRLILGGALILLATLVGVRGNESAEPLPERPPGLTGLGALLGEVSPGGAAAGRGSSRGSRHPSAA